MKKKIALVLALSMMIALVSGCRIVKKSDNPAPTQTTQTDQTPASEPETGSEPENRSEAPEQERPQEPTAAPAPEQKEEASDSTMFDETYWTWNIDVTVGTIFYVLMHDNGTLSYININDKGADAVVTVRYTYENGKLWIEDTPYRDVPLTYHLRSDGVFESDEVVPSQDDDFHVCLWPDPDARYLDQV